MSDAKPYHITDELGATIGTVTLDREAILRAFNAVPAPPPPPPGYTLYPGQDPAEAMADLSAGDTLWLADGTHPHAIHLTKALNVRAVAEAVPVVSGWKPVDWEHYAGEVYRTLWTRSVWDLSHHIVSNAAFLSAPDGPARMAAHNLATQPEMVAYDGEPFRRVSLDGLLKSAYAPMIQAYDEKNAWLYISLPVGGDIDLVQVATLPQLFTAADGVAGITVEGLTFTGAANTHKQGAFTLHSDGNTLRGLSVEMVNSLGYSIRGIGLTMDNVNAADCGQMGHWLKIQKSTIKNCGHTGSNWRGSDAGWHASNKWEQSLDNTVRGWYAIDTNGAGLWLDIGNHGNTFEGLDLLGCGKNALMVEHYAERNIFSGTIRGTRSLGRWAGADIQIQSNVKDNTFEGIDITGSTVPYWLVYKTTGDPRGSSGPNEFLNINASGRPMLIQPARHEKDVFENIT